MKLRDYQRADACKILGAFARHRSVLYVLPTGAGKTVVGGEIVRQEHAETLFLAHRRELVLQARTRLLESGLRPDEVGIIMAGHPENRTARVQVASIDTLVHRDRPPAKLVVIDEAHHAAAESWTTLLRAYRKARWLGLTATPHRYSGEPLSQHFDAMVEGVKMSALIEQNWIMKPRVFTKRGALPDLKGVKVVGGDYARGELSRRVNRRELVGDIVAHWKALAAGRRTILFAVDVAHATRITRRFLRAGVAAECVHGGTPPQVRAAALGPGGRLDRGETRVVATCMIVSEGWDMPSVKCAILARPTRSTVLYIQQSGRILRPYEDTEGEFQGIALPPLILDHSGNALAHGLPHHDRVWSLEKKVVAGKAGAPPTRACPVCDEIVLACLEACACGHVFPRSRDIEEKRREELVEVERAEAAKIASEKVKILAFARMKRFANAEAWAKKVVEAKFGRSA